MLSYSTSWCIYDGRNWYIRNRTGFIGILKQKLSESKQESIVRFHSGIWLGPQKNYSTVKNEVVSIVNCISKFQDDLINQKFLLRADCKSAKENVKFWFPNRFLQDGKLYYLFLFWYLSILIKLKRKTPQCVTSSFISLFCDFWFFFQLADLLLLLSLVFLTCRVAWFYDNILDLYVYLLVHTLFYIHYQFFLKKNHPILSYYINQNRTYIFKNYTTWNIKVCEFLV